MRTNNKNHYSAKTLCLKMLLCFFLGAAVQAQPKPEPELSYIWGQQFYSYLNSKKTLMFASEMQNARPTSGDLDKDGDTDILIGFKDGSLAYFENLGTKSQADFELKTRNMMHINENGDWKMISMKGPVSPVLFDIDLDGDLDLLVAETDGQVSLFENNTSVGRGFFFTLKNRALLRLRVSQNPKIEIADLNGDGLPDLIAGFSHGIIAYIPNNGKPGAPDWRDNPQEVVSLAYLEKASPTLEDWDGDGDLDMLVGTLSGSLYYFANNGDAKNHRFEPKPFSFKFETDVYGESSPHFMDLNGDGVKDLIVGNNTSKVWQYESRDPGNDGRQLWSISDNMFGFQRLISYGSSASPTFGDIDGDKDMDMLVAEADGTINIFVNINTPQTPNWIQTKYDLLKELNLDTPNPELGDLNGDGFADMLVGNGLGALKYFENTGNKDNPSWRLADPNFFKITGVSKLLPRLTDFDKDGDLDLFIADNDGNMEYFENTGDPKKPQMVKRDFPLAEPKIDRRSGMTFFPWRRNNMDSLIAAYNGTLSLAKDRLTDEYRRAAENLKIAESEQRPGTKMIFMPLPYIHLPPVMRDAKPYAVDMNGDRELDLIIGSADGSIFYFQNKGFEKFDMPPELPVKKPPVNLDPRFEERPEILYQSKLQRLTPSFGDLNDDLALDMVIGSAEGQLTLIMNKGDEFTPQFATNAQEILKKGPDKNISPAMADFDGDGDLDIIVGTKEGNFFLMENTGTRKNYEFSTPPRVLREVRVNKNSTPAVWFDQTASSIQPPKIIAGDILGRLSLLNLEKSLFGGWRFEAGTRGFLGIDIGIGASPFVTDMNFDGQPELIVGSDSGTLHVFQNWSAGSGRILENPAYLPNYKFPPGTFPTMADIDGDLDQDLVVGTMDGQMLYFKNLAVNEQ